MIKQTFSLEQSFQPRGAPVLVSGASFAGLATAYWMNRLGYRVNLIEVASGLRNVGTPVDIEGGEDRRSRSHGNDGCRPHEGAPPSRALMFPSDQVEILERNRKLSGGTIDL